MIASRTGALLILAAASLGVVGCSSYGTSRYGVSAGYDGYYDDYGYGSSYYPASHYGWNGGFYYPGTGYYVYDSGGRGHRWNDGQRRYWESRRDRREVRANWSEFRRDRREDRAEYRTERREDRRAVRSGQVSRPEYRADRREDRREYQQERRQDRREVRRENRRDRRD